MKKMLVLSLMLSAMAIGNAMANDVNAANERGPRKVSITINVPPRHHHARPARPHKDVCRECPPCHEHHRVGKPHRPVPHPVHPHAISEHGKPHNHNGHGAPGKGHPKPGGDRPCNCKR